MSEVSAGDTPMAGDWTHLVGSSLPYLGPGVGIAKAWASPGLIPWLYAAPPCDLSSSQHGSWREKVPRTSI